MTEKQPKNYQEKAYWDERQDDITIIYLDKREQAEELAEIEQIEKELQLYF